MTIFLRHQSIEACLGELRRNQDLRRLIGIESEGGVPKKWNMSRFMEVLGQEPFLSELRRVFDVMVRRLGEAVPDLGVNCSGDATGLRGRKGSGAAEERREGLPQPDGGRKEYLNDRGEVDRVLEWFGYKLHLIVDAKHEVALGYKVTSATGSDNEALPEVFAEAQKNLPSGRMKTLAYDKAADDEKVHKMLKCVGVMPVIEVRNLWKEEYERMLPGHTGMSNVVYDEAGTVYCYDKASDPPVRHRMAYMGREPGRGTLKYRCPARHEGRECPSDARCNAGRLHGKTVRVKQEIDIRRFPPIPRATKEFERLYRGRSAVERVNARLKVFWGADDGNIAGARRFHAFVGALMVVHAAFATALALTPRYEGTLSRMNLAPVQDALRKAVELGKG